MEERKHAVGKSINKRTLFRCCVCDDLKRYCLTVKTGLCYPNVTQYVVIYHCRRCGQITADTILFCTDRSAVMFVLIF